jgi:hypothetical protein
MQKRFSTLCERVCASSKRRSSPTQVPRQVARPHPSPAPTAATAKGLRQ